MCDRRTKAPPKAKAPAAKSEQTTKANATTRAVIAEIQRKGATTLAAIAQEIEARGMRTPARRSTWQPVQVSRLLAVTSLRVGRRWRPRPPFDHHSRGPLKPRCKIYSQLSRNCRFDRTLTLHEYASRIQALQHHVSGACAHGRP
jgi:hypothetical protein